MQEILNTEIVEIELVAGQLTYPLKYQETVQNARVTGIAVYPGAGKSKSGFDLVSPDNAYIKLFDRKNDMKMELGLAFLRFNPGTPFLHVVPLDFKRVDWIKSEIYFAAGSAVANDTALQLQVTYERIEGTD